MTALKMMLVLALALAVDGGAARAAELTEPLAAALIKVKNDEAVIIDVREAAEIKDGMVEQAIWLPTTEIQSKSGRYAETLAKLPKDKPVYVYCASGVRSDAFADALEVLGYKAANLGGYVELTAAGFTVKKPKD